MTTVERLQGVQTGLGIKAPVKLATTANITLSGTQTIDGVAAVAGDRVLVKDQSTASENGIWVVASAAWARAEDFDGSYDVEQGTLVTVAQGTANGSKTFIQTTASPTIGTSNLVFSAYAVAAADVANVDQNETITGDWTIDGNWTFKGLALPTRNAANATIAAAFADNTIVLMGNLFYKVDSSKTGAASCTNDLSVNGLVPFGEVRFEHFGAVGDGTTDDTTAIQAAISYGQNIGSDGARKTYRITATLVANDDNQEIDLDYSTLYMDDATGLLSHLDVGDNTTQCNGVRLRRIVFTRAQVATAGAAIRPRYVGVLSIEDCRVFGDSKIYRGIEMSRGIICEILDCYIQDTVDLGMYFVGTGTGANRCVDIEIYKCRVEGTGDSGMECGDYTEGFFVRDNIFFNTATACVSIAPPANPLFSFKFEGNDFDTSGGKGLYIKDVNNITVNDNWFSSNTGISLHIDTGTTGVVVAGNQMYGTGGQNNIEVAGSDVMISGNYISAGANGVYLKSTADNIGIAGNVIRNCTAYGVHALEGPSDIAVGANFLENNTTADVSTGWAISSITAADPLPIPDGGNVFSVTGNTNFGQISGGWPGREITLIFSGTPTLTHTGAGGVTTMVLNGASNFVAAASNTLTLIHSGDRWYEKARKV